MFKLTMIVTLLSAAVYMPHSTQAKTCVLSLYHPTKDSAETKMFNRVFRFDPNVDFYELAQPSQIERCFTSGSYSEIVWLSHGLSQQSGATDYSAPLITYQDGKRFPLLKSYFKKLAANINYTKLKRVRIMSCSIDFSANSVNTDSQTENIKSTIDILVKQLIKSGVSVDLSPQQKTLSWLIGENVTRVSYDWLARNIDRSRLTIWQTNENAWCDRDSLEGCDRATASITVPLGPMKSAHEE